ncbi:MAG TPA: hypothetical protein PKA05_02365 [Roseiflexaceae bacterium]|nr:hypothetical protein [Roseiflexaceae bacterium]HMP39198.1 hypothetical protein [Roseiflexaceae bacterium]
MTTTILDRAAMFLWQHARLLERRRFAYHFLGGTREAIAAALLAYQNSDGGFGNALEPDIRCPDSQPVPTQHALEILDEIGFEPAGIQRICDYLMTITTAEGGVPWLLPSAMHYPRAPWWNTSDQPAAAINPTAAIAGLLHKHHVTHPWLDRATEFCWAQIAALYPTEQHDTGVAITFLQYVPDRQRAGRELDRLAQQMTTTGLIADLAASDYVRKPLDWAPTPDHPLRPYFSDTLINAHLDLMIAEQQADGGWDINFPAFHPVCGAEWRGWVTLSRLQTLQAYGRLG